MTTESVTEKTRRLIDTGAVRITARIADGGIVATVTGDTGDYRVTMDSSGAPPGRAPLASRTARAPATPRRAVGQTGTIRADRGHDYCLSRRPPR